MKNFLILIFLLTSCQSLPLVLKEAEEIAVEEAVEIEFHKEKHSLNLTVDVKKEENNQEGEHASSQIREP